MRILVDVSFWNQELTPANWEVISRGVDGVVVRFGYSATRDSWSQTYINQCKKLGLPYAGYWYVYTDQSLAKQAAAIASSVNELKPCAIWIDIEDVSSVMSKSAQAKYYYDLRCAVGTLLTTQKGCYSGDWYINMFGGALNWVKQDTYWEAAYLAWYEAAWWKLFKAKWGIMDVDKLHEIAEYAGIHNGVMRQIESKIPVAGLPLSLDWNIMADDNFAKIFTNGSDVPYIPPEFVSYIVSTILGVNVRATPSLTGKKIGALPYKTIVSIQTKNITAGWGQLVSSPYSQGWVFLSNLKAL
jgi:hypothetical protein